tara:strand:- start:3267 stop:5135 length:1869 start_codon:yes stop_codon:yes gene_type:complete
MAGRVHYPGFEEFIESYSHSYGVGVAPSTATVVTVPQPLTKMPLFGPLSIDGGEVLFENALLDKAHVVSTSSGQRLKLTFKDWRWLLDYVYITGEVNRRRADGEFDVIDPNSNNFFLNNKLSAQEIAQKVADDIQITLGAQAPAIDTANFPKDQYPYFNWNNVTAGRVLSELAKKCSLLPCPDLGNPMRMRFEENNVGAWPAIGGVVSVDTGYNPPELPKVIKIVSAPINYVKSLELHAAATDVIKNWDSYKPIYPPELKDYFIHAYLGPYHNRNGRFPQHLGAQEIPAAELAAEYFEIYQLGSPYVKYATAPATPPLELFEKTTLFNQAGDKITHLRQIALHQYLPRPNKTTGEKVPGFVWGRFDKARANKPGNNTTRATIQVHLDPINMLLPNQYDDYRGQRLSVRGCTDLKIDPKTRAVRFTHQIFQWEGDKADDDFIDEGDIKEPAELYLKTGFNLRTSNNGDFDRRTTDIPANPQGVGELVVYRDDLQPFRDLDFDEDNFDSIEDEAKKIGWDIFREMQSAAVGQQSSHVGIWGAPSGVVLNGALKSVGHTINKSGSTTTLNIKFDTAFDWAVDNEANEMRWWAKKAHKRDLQEIMLFNSSDMLRDNEAEPFKFPKR